LLLGAGESGKSTIAKQIKILYLQQWEDTERNSYKGIIYNNILTGMKNIVEFCEEKKIALPEAEKTWMVELQIGAALSLSFGEKEKQVVSVLWASPGAKEAWDRRNEYQLIDSCAYYFDKLDAIAQASWIPSNDDILRCRSKTTGIIETSFEVKQGKAGSIKFLLVDVGGQRSERKKWIHCFEDVTAVLFCVALSEYDQTLYEEHGDNRMMESMKLFKEICNSKWFANHKGMILFLNKKDIFLEKIKKRDLTCVWEEYSGGNDPDVAIKFIKDKFVSLNDNPNKTIFVHETNATDTRNIEIIFNATKDILLRDILTTSVGI